MIAIKISIDENSFQNSNLTENIVKTPNRHPADILSKISYKHPAHIVQTTYKHRKDVIAQT